MRARRLVAVLVAVLALYLVLVGYRGVLLVRSGEPAAVGLGVGVLILPVVAGLLVAREVRFGSQTQRLGEQLAAEGGLPVDDLPRRRSGRVVRAAADARFEQFRDEVDAAPQDWRPWYRLGIAYDDAGDRSRARAAMRRAIALAPPRR